MTPDRLNDVPEVLEVHVVPSDEVRMVPELPTATCDGLEVVLVLDVSLFLAQENIVKLKTKINIMYIFFIFISFLIYILNIQSNSDCRYNPLYLRTVDLCLPFVKTSILLIVVCFTRNGKVVETV